MRERMDAYLRGSVAWRRHAVGVCVCWLWVLLLELCSNSGSSQRDSWILHKLGQVCEFSFQ
jgi:hypothetical protein